MVKDNIIDELKRMNAGERFDNPAYQNPELAKEIVADWINEEHEEKGLIISKELKKIILQYYGKRDLAKKILDIQPLHYDENKIWWAWKEDEFKWKMIDDIDVLNFVRKLSYANTVKSKEKIEILEALKQEARLRKPKNIAETWIQFKDSFVDIKTGEEFPVSFEYFATNPIPYPLHNERFLETPTIDRIFEEWVGKDYIKTLYEIIAYCLIPSYPIHRLFCLIGSGLNGKSCFLRLLQKFIGKDNVTSTELDNLLNSRFEVTRLHKKLVCIMGETNFSELSQTSVIKKLTGQDMIGFEYKNKNPFNDINYAKILIATNNLPTTTDKTVGFYRRWLIIEFPNQFSENEDILQKIPEEEYECLTVKSLIFLKDLLDRREFYNEGTIEDKTKKYEEKSNFFDKFWKDNVLEDYDSYITINDFEKKLSSFCRNNHQRMLSSKSIHEKMGDKGIEQGRPYMEWWENDKSIKRQVRAWMCIRWR